MKPMRLKKGTARAVIYEARENYLVCWRLDGKRRRRTAATLEQAKAEAERILESLDRGHGSLTTVTDRQLSYYQACEDRLGGTPLHVAVEEYLKFHGFPSSPCTVGEAIARYQKHQATQGLSPRYLETSAHHLSAFARAFPGQLSAVTPEQIAHYLGRHAWSLRTKANHRRSLVTMFGWAQKMGLLPEGRPTAAMRCPEFSPRPATPGTLSAADLQRLLAGSSGYLRNYLAIAAFTGMRSSEIMRLRWENIRWSERVIFLPKEITKTAYRRTVPILPALARWVVAEDTEGDVMPVRSPHDALQALCKKLGVEWEHNALRHSFASCHLAAFGDAGKTATICGHSLRVLETEYKDLKSPAEGKAWFDVSPPNILRVDKKSVDSLPVEA